MAGSTVGYCTICVQSYRCSLARSHAAADATRGAGNEVQLFLQLDSTIVTVFEPCRNSTRICDPLLNITRTAHHSVTAPEMRICVLTAWLPNPFNMLCSNSLPANAIAILQENGFDPRSSTRSWWTAVHHGIEQCNMGEGEKRL